MKEGFLEQLLSSKWSDGGEARRRMWMGEMGKGGGVGGWGGSVKQSVNIENQRKHQRRYKVSSSISAELSFDPVV